MTLTRIHCERFTAFETIDVTLSPGVNVLVGANGTGQTHLLKIAYAACDITKSGLQYAEKLCRVFLPSGRSLARLIQRVGTSTRGFVEVHRGNGKIRASFTNHTTKSDSATVTKSEEWGNPPIESVYIPVKEMLSSAPGFRSLYTQREIHFEEIYADIIDRAYRPALRGPADKDRRKLLDTLRKSMDGKVLVRNDEFFLSNRQGNLEFTLLAEGMRKLGLLWVLIQNGTLFEGSVLFWDEPETNLNPKMYGTLVDILLQLQRMGVQVFLATHDYVILKELDLRKRNEDCVAYHSLYREESKSGSPVRCHTVERYLDVHPNVIAETFTDLYDREVKRSLGRNER